MRQTLKDAFCFEMDAGIRLYMLNEFDAAFYHLERAHILGQCYIIPHTKSHWWMLKVGLKQHKYRDAFGQVTRIIASLLSSKIWVPIGNTGGSNVNPFKPMAIPEDLKKVLQS